MGESGGRFYTVVFGNFETAYPQCLREQVKILIKKVVPREPQRPELLIAYVYQLEFWLIAIQCLRVTEDILQVLPSLDQ